MCLRSEPTMPANSSDPSRIFRAVPWREKRRLSGRPSSSATTAFSMSGMYSTRYPDALAFPSQTASASASTPSDVLAETGMTGTPRMEDRASTSILNFFLASSILVRAIIVGRPSSSASKQSTRLLTRLVASATRITESL